MQIAASTVATIEYTLTDDDGTVIDTSKGKQPLVYLHGAGNLIPGLESELAGRAAGDELKVRIPPEQAYGQRDAANVQEVPLGDLPTDPPPAVGMQYQAHGPQGVMLVTIAAVEGEVVTLDANHPLAGVTLNFEVKVVEVRAATEEELDHGHVHGPGGHEH